MVRMSKSPLLVSSQVGGSEFSGVGGNVLPSATVAVISVISIVFIFVFCLSCLIIKLYFTYSGSETPHSLLLFMTSRMLKPKIDLVLSVMVRIELTTFLRITVFSSTTELHN